MLESSAIAFFVQIIAIIILPLLYFSKKVMAFSSPAKGRCPPPPPSSPADSLRRSGTTGVDSTHRDQQQQPLPQQQIADLLQYAQSSYTTNPTDALSAIMDALTLSTGTDTAAQHAISRIRSELGDAVADSVAGTTSNQSFQQSQYQHVQSSPLSEREMTLRAMEMVQQLLNDTTTILYSQGRQHLLQQAMEDGSSVVCSKCGDVISRERWTQHAEYWCRGIEEDKSCNDDDSMAMED
ncbi:hypothetical protein ACHAWF_016223 [Thalassiosira exigua]